MVATAIVGSAVIGAGASLAGSAMQADAAGSAGDAQLRQYYQTRADLAPYRELGTTALGELGALYGVGRKGLLTPEEINAARDRFQASPGYQFAYNEGLNALDKSASARGRLQGGGYGRELVRYGQGMANQEFGNYANRLAQLAGIGQTSTTATGQFGQTATTNAGNAMVDAATARASGYTGAANAFGGAVGNYVMYDYLNRKPPAQVSYGGGLA